jgi:hypothetical protein
MEGLVMRNTLKASAIFVALVAMPMGARADMVGAVAGAGTGLIVAGPVGAVAGGIIGGVFGKPYWGPARSRTSCWIDDNFHRHCRRAW